MECDPSGFEPHHVSRLTAALVVGREALSQGEHSAMTDLACGNAPSRPEWGEVHVSHGQRWDANLHANRLGVTLLSRVVNPRAGRPQGEHCSVANTARPGIAPVHVHDASPGRFPRTGAAAKAVDDRGGRAGRRRRPRRLRICAPANRTACVESAGSRETCGRATH
jgi:hypothetical protein